MLLGEKEQKQSGKKLRESVGQDLHYEGHRTKRKKKKNLGGKRKGWRRVWNQRGRVGGQIDGDENGCQRVVGPWC